MGVKLDNKIIYLEVIDMSFTEESKNFILQSIFEASAAILVYNIGNSLTFQGINVWLERIKKHFPCEKMILVGNQTDLDDVQIENEEKKDENDDLFEDLFGDYFEKKKLREVETEEGQKKCDETDCIIKFIEASAKNGTNVDKIFIEVAKLLDKKDNVVSNKKGKCCGCC